MDIDKITQLYAHAPETGAVRKAIDNNKLQYIYLSGLMASAASVVFASLADKMKTPVLFKMPMRPVISITILRK